MKTKLLVFLIFLSNIVYSQPGWLNQNSGITDDLLSVWVLNENIVYAGGNNGKLLKTTDSGLNWTLIQINLNTIYSVRFIDENTGFCLGSSLSGDLYSAKTTNAGINWNLGLVDTVNTGASQFVNANTGYAVDSNGVFKSVDGGATWNLVHASAGNIPTNLFFINLNFGWVCGRNGMIRKTTDGGSTWATVNCGSATNLRDVHFINGFTGWTVGDDSRVYRSTNMGNSWSMVGGNSLCGLRGVHFTDASNGWITGCEGAVNKTTDGGVNWVLQSFAGTTYFNDIKFANSVTGWVVGNGGKILKTTNGGITPKILNLTVLIEGFYNDVTNSMITDTIRVLLRTAGFPYVFVDSWKGPLNDLGQTTVSFENAVNSLAYFIVIFHRNSIETWSGVKWFSNDVMTYNFTTSSSQAWGNNMKRKGTKWTIFSGDVNQDGFVDATDAGLIDNDAYIFSSGYINTDLTGDNISDGTDLAIVDNNSFNFVSVIRP